MKKNEGFLTPMGLKYEVPLSTGVIISRHGVEVVAGPIPPNLMAKYVEESHEMQIRYDEHERELQKHLIKLI